MPDKDAMTPSRSKVINLMKQASRFIRLPVFYEPRLIGASRVDKSRLSTRAA